MQSTPLISKASNLLTTVKCNAGVDGSRSSQRAATPLLSVSKPSWISGSGSGRVDCHKCHGRGAGAVEEAILGYCDRCLGTGEYSSIMGFQFMKRDTDHIQDNRGVSNGR